MQKRQLLFLTTIGIFILISFSSCCVLNDLNHKVYLAPHMSQISGDSYKDGEAIMGFEADYAVEWGCITGSAGNSSCDCPEGKASSHHSGFAFGAGIGFSRQGGGYKESNAVKGKIVTSYVNVPVMARYWTDGGFYFEGGLQPGILLSAKDKYDSNTDDFKSYFKSFDLGLPLGMGYQFENGFGLGLRVTPGIANIDKEKGDAEDQPNKNFVAGINLFYSFGSKKKRS
jgi:hypothetical protein